MKKISLKNVKNSLSRDEMRLIAGGQRFPPPGCFNCGSGCQWMDYTICENGHLPEPCGDGGNC
jgi:natural product precursor